MVYGLFQILDVIRPADLEETAGAFVAALQRTNGPTGLILTRQNVPNLNEISVSDRREGVLKGGYIARKETEELELIILASGSELSVAMEAANQLGNSVRVVSMPCMERFDRQDSEYRDSVLPKGFRHRMAVEAGVSDLGENMLDLKESWSVLTASVFLLPAIPCLANLEFRSRMWSNRLPSPACGSDKSINLSSRSLDRAEINKWYENSFFVHD